MKIILLGILFGFLLIGISRAEDLPACCGATTERLDLLGRTNGWGHNLPPQDSVRFGQQSLNSESQSYMSKDPSSTIAPEPRYGQNFGLANLEDGGYNPGTGSYTPSKETNPEWYRSKKGWASHNLKKYWNLR